jgi:hypothetical protein
MLNRERREARRISLGRGTQQHPNFRSETPMNTESVSKVEVHRRSQATSACDFIDVQAVVVPSPLNAIAVDPPVTTPVSAAQPSIGSTPCRPSSCRACRCGGRSELDCCELSVSGRQFRWRRWLPLMIMAGVLILLTLGATVHPLVTSVAIGLWVGVKVIDESPSSYEP